MILALFATLTIQKILIRLYTDMGDAKTIHFKFSVFRFFGAIIILTIPFLSIKSEENDLSVSFEYDFKGYIEYESRYFLEKDRKRVASKTNQSFATSFELFLENINDNWSVLFAPFARIDQRDPARTILDINEFYLSVNKPNWELKLGSKQIFWGVLESNHLIDIINQTNSSENIDLEDKFGQPMLNFTWIDQLGTFDFFLMTNNRKRRFVSSEGRPHTGFEESFKIGVFDNKKNLFDYIFRYENSGNIFDVGLYYFNGVARSPSVVTLSEQSQSDFFVLYPRIQQLAVDLQVTVASTLFKLEGLFRDSEREDYGAFGLGLEHTIYGLFNTRKDLALLVEYHWDEKDEESNSQFSNDIFFGIRLISNAEDDGQILLGVVQNLCDGSTTAFVEGSKRLPKDWKVNLEGRLFSLIDNNNPLTNLNDDTYLQLAITKFF